MADFRLLLKLDVSKLESLVFQEFYKVVGKANKETFKTLPQLTSKLKDLTRETMENGVMYKELTNGTQLLGEFGIPSGDGQDTADTIVNIISKNIVIDFSGYKVLGRAIQGRLTVYLLPRVYDQLKRHKKGIVTTDKGEAIRWLEWSLTKGESMCVADYNVFFKNGAGRSGFAIMIKQVGKFWSVPKKVAGTIKDNWITREMADARDEYKNIVQETFQTILDNVI